MKQNIVFMFLFFIFFGLFFINPNYSETEKVSIFENTINIKCSIEHYLEKQNWTPIVLSFENFSLSFWMNKGGQVFELPVNDSIKTIPIFTIDINHEYVLVDNSYYSFLIYENNNIRTRFKLLNINVQFVVKHPQYNNTVDFYLDENKLDIKNVRIDVINSYEFRFFGKSVVTYSNLIINKKKNINHSINKGGKI